MFVSNKTSNTEETYRHLISVVKDLLTSEKDETACLAMVSAYIFAYIDELNWAGFYMLKDDELVLAPFQGKPACLRIKKDRGVCGKAFSAAETVVVPNVHDFADHIACDGDTNSEIVLPLFRNGVCCGVMDIDSRKFDRFGDSEKNCLNTIAQAVSEFLS